MAVKRKSKLARSRLKILKVGVVVVALTIITSPLEAKRIQPLTTYCPAFTTGWAYRNGVDIGYINRLYNLDESDCIRQCGQVVGATAVSYGIKESYNGKCVCEKGANEIDVDDTRSKACLLPDIDPVDCRYSWDQWSSCQGSCGRGTKKRTAIVTRQPNRLGKQCPKPDYKTCDLQPCPIDCEYSWDQWSPCQGSCGQGTMERTAIVTKQPTKLGKQCPRPEVKICYNSPCPIDCEYNWDQWSSCQGSCGRGTKERTAIVTRQPNRLGKQCPRPEVKICYNSPCPIDCEYSWDQWSSCQGSCGRGTKERTAIVTKQPNRLGKQCPKLGYKMCDLPACECEYNYGPWNTCNETCGIGTEIRTKSIKSNVNQLHLRCDKANSETKKCYNFDCNIYPTCDLFEVKFESSVVKPRLDLKIKLNRQPNLDKTIVAQKLQLVNKQNTKIGTEVTWPMSENEKYSRVIVPVYFEKQLTTENECKAGDQTCLISIKTLKLKSTFKLNLVVYEKTNIKNRVHHSPELKAWHCPLEDIVLDEWKCDENETIPIFQLCNGKRECSNGRDEEDGNCKGSRYLKNAGIAVIVTLVFSIIIAGLVKYTEQKQRIAEKLETVPKSSNKKNKKSDKHKNEFFKFLELTCVKDRDWNEEQVNIFTELGIQNRMLILDYFGIVSRNHLEIAVKTNDKLFSATPKATQKILKSNKTTTELMKSITSVQLGRSWAEEVISITKTFLCKSNPDENYFGIISLIKDGILEVLKLLLKGQGVHSVLIFILIIVHFNSEILRKEYILIEGLDLLQITILMTTLLAINSIMTTIIGLQTIHQNLRKWQKLALCLPFCTETFILFSKLQNYWIKYNLQKELIDANQSKKWPIVAKKIRENKHVQRHIELLESASNTMNGVTGAIRNVSFLICTILVIIRPSIRNLMTKTLLKTIPNIITILSIISLVTVSMDLTSFKTKSSILSMGYNLYFAGILTLLLPRVWLTALFAAQNSALIILPLIILSVTIFIANRVFNDIFKSLTFSEQISYCIISSTVPVTVKEGIEEKKNINFDKIDDATDSINYERKRLFNQGLSIFIINLVGLGLISGGILIQSNMNEDYHESVHELFLKPYNLGLTSTICLGFLSYIVGCIIFLIYYAKAHPNILHYYDKFEKFSVLPQIHIDLENIDSNKIPVKARTNHETLVSRVKKSFHKKSKRKNDKDNTDTTGRAPDYSSPIRGVPEYKTPSSQTREDIESDKSSTHPKRGPKKGQVESHNTHEGEDFEFPTRKLRRKRNGDSKEGDEGWRPTPPRRKKPGEPKGLFPPNQDEIEMQIRTSPKKTQKLPNKDLVPCQEGDEGWRPMPPSRKKPGEPKGLFPPNQDEIEMQIRTSPKKTQKLPNKDLVPCQEGDEGWRPTPPSRKKPGEPKDMVPCQEGDEGWRSMPPRRKKPGEPKVADLFPPNQDEIEMKLRTPPKKTQKLPNKDPFISKDNGEESRLTTPTERRLAVPNKVAGLAQFKDSEVEAQPTTPPIRSRLPQNKDMKREMSPYTLQGRKKPPIPESKKPVGTKTKI